MILFLVAVVALCLYLAFSDKGPPNGGNPALVQPS